MLAPVAAWLILFGCDTPKPKTVEEAKSAIQPDMTVEQVERLLGAKSAPAIENGEFEMHEWELEDGTVITVSFSKGKAFRVHEGGFMLGDSDTGAFSSAYSKD